VDEKENATEVQTLVQQLADPRQRRRARRALVAAGAAGPLLECLDSVNESVVWAAVESLGELRAVEAIEPLVELLERGRLALDVAEALTLITGQDFGVDPRKWRRWLAETPQGPSRTAGIDAARCVHQVAELLGVEATAAGDHTHWFRLPLAGGRTQKVAVIFGRTDHEGQPLVTIYSECGPADPKLYEAVLRKNLTIPSGAFAVRDIDGRPNLVMVANRVAAAVTPRILARCIENIAARSDRLEKGLAGEDRR